MIVYLVTNTVTGLRYVGITSRPLRVRWLEQCATAKRRKGFMLHVDIRKYGAAAFTVEQIDTAPDWVALCRLECEWIAKLGTAKPQGYNLTIGGDGTVGHKLSDDARARISAARKGKALSQEHRNKLSAAKMGRKLSPRSAQHSARISDGLRRAWARRKAAQ